MSIIGHDNHSDRLASLITQARSVLKPSNPASDSTSSTNLPNLETIKKVDATLSEAQAIASGLETYTQRCSNLPNPNDQSTKIVKEILDANEATDWDELYATGQTKFKLMSAMTSNSYEAGVYGFLIGLLRPRRVLEIGMFTGTVTTVFAAGSSVEKVVGLEAEPFLEGWCRPFWKRAGEGVNEKIEVRVGPAKDSLEKMASDGETPFDMILIDADKRSYPTYFRQILDHKLLSPGGVLMIDNAIYKGTAYVPFSLDSGLAEESLLKEINEVGKLLNDFNEEVCAHPAIDVLLLPARDGLSLVKWKQA